MIDSIRIPDYPWVSLPYSDPEGQRLIRLIYDPTNGTVSRGEIFRVGGVRPLSRPVGLFYDIASQAK
jgi:hypothetical protein